ncbi:MAG: insulinase family protein [Proteobacteria bacterium]|nr:insulinase family protein [Pseudomonadota bacterium]MBU2261822.1 insulinase family protein [Pseudomonadota bacterium]
MNVKTACPPPTLAAGETRHGFQILRVEQIPEIRITAYEVEHEKTGAKLLHVHCSDKENLFSVGFRTPPRDSTGVPHILEHSVLAGSEHYPLKDVFNELLRGTLQTFINAFTYPDKTIYPVASQEKKDFFNLARVYADLVFRPRLLRETFLQEGHHLEFAANGELTVSGIVYNEMKGAYSSPDTLMYKALQENLYPETPYSCDSGGDPEAIPALTYEQFREFHRTFYSPTNARFFLYGDIPTAEHLAFLAGLLGEFTRVAVDSSVGLQRRWRKPRSVHRFYPIDPEEKPAGKTSVNMAWMTAENTDGETAMLLTIVADLLVGSAAAPLRKALIDSGLGEDLSPVTGLERDLRQIAFAVGLRGTDPDKTPRIEALILDTLKKTAEDGFDRKLIEGTLHQVEFHGREMVRSSYPYGIVLLGRAYHAWLYGGDPLRELNFPRTIREIRRKWDANPALFQEVVRSWLLENPHRLLSVVEPSRTFQKEREQADRERMARLAASLSPEEQERIRQETLMLKQFQTQPDSPEAAATLPKLKISDISREIEKIPTDRAGIEGVPVLTHDLFTNGIAYLDLAFDVSDVPEDLQTYLPLLGNLTVQMGAAGLSYEEMAKRIALRTGGLGAGLAAGLTADGSGTWQKLIFSVKALYRNTDEALGIMRDILTEGDLTDDARMRDLILEEKNGLHAAVIPSGHLFAQMAAAASLSLPAWRNEQWHGRTQLRFISGTADRLNEIREDLREKMMRLREIVFVRKRLLLNMTADAEGLKGLVGAANGLIQALPEGNPAGATTEPTRSRTHIGIAIPAQVCYVAKVLAAPPYADPLSAALFVLARKLSNGYLYRRIRVQGGAYGGSCRYDPVTGLFAFLSYRDPHLVETLNAYRDAVDSVRTGRIEPEELEKAVIGAIGALDRPLDPAGRGYTALIREFSALTDAVRSRFRSDVLNITPEVIRETAQRHLAPAAGAEVIAVCAAEERLKQANEVLTMEMTLEKLTAS